MLDLGSSRDLASWGILARIFRRLSTIRAGSAVGRWFPRVAGNTSLMRGEGAHRYVDAARSRVESAGRNGVQSIHHRVGEDGRRSRLCTRLCGGVDAIDAAGG